MFLLGQLSIIGLNWLSSAFDAQLADAVYEKKRGILLFWADVPMHSFEEKPHAVCCLYSVVKKIYPAQSETLGRSCERGGDVCEDPVSLRQIVTSSAIIHLVEGFLKVGHIACLIFCWNTVLP